MAKLIKGKDVADRLSAVTVRKSRELSERGTKPTLAIVRLGMKPEDGA